MTITLNAKTVNVSESLFDSDEKMSEMSCDEYPVFRTKESKKKLAGKRRAES